MNRTLKIVILIAVSISILSVSIFADTVWSSLYYDVPGTDTNVLFYVRGTSSGWNLVESEISIDRVYSYKDSHITSWAYTATHSNTTGTENGVGKNIVYDNNGYLGSSVNSEKYFIWERNIVLDIGLNNGTYDAVTLNNYFRSFSVNKDNSYGYSDFDIIYNPNNIKVYPNSNHQFIVYFQELYDSVNPGMVMDQRTEYSCLISYKMFAVTNTNNAPSNTLTLTNYTDGINLATLSPQYTNKVISRYDNVTYSEIVSINNKVNEIINAYNNNSSTANNVISESSQLDNTIDTVHQQEMDFYRRNEQALQASGLSNFNYDDDVRLGYQGILTDFDKLWKALGKWNFVYTFTLILSLATFILRHKPWTTNHTHKDN